MLSMLRFASSRLLLAIGITSSIEKVADVADVVNVADVYSLVCFEKECESKI